MEGASKKGLRINVRKMEEEDIESVLEIDRKIVGLERATTYSAIPANYVGGELEISVVAEAEGKIIGFLLGRVTDSPYGEGDSFLMELIGVDPEYKRRGVGRSLVKAFEKSCREKGASTIRVLVSWHDWWLLSFLRSLDFSHGDMAEFVKPLEL
jgi:ribosomal protein S18 acetylase RimI-like enzyme